MTRNLKALGLALIAALAMSAVAASAAQADLEVTVEEAGATLTGVQVEHPGGESLHTFTLSSGRVLRCTTASFTGELAEAAQTEVTVHPTYSGCTANLTQPVTVTMNGCDFRFHGGEVTAPDPHHALGLVDLVCPGEGPTIDVYTNHTQHTAGNTLCKYTVEPFVNKQVTYTNTTNSDPETNDGKDDIDLVANSVVTNVHREQGTQLNCGGTEQTATYTGTATVTAEDHDGNPLDLTVSTSE